MSLDTVNTKRKFEKIEPKYVNKIESRQLFFEKCLEVNHEKITTY